MNSSRFYIFLSRRKVTMAIAVLLLSGIAPAEAVQPVQLFQPFHFICVDGKTSQLIDGGFGKKAVCRNSSYSFRVDVLSGSESTRNPLSVFLCIDRFTKVISYGTSTTAYCSDGNYFKVRAFNLVTTTLPTEDVHIICTKWLKLTYGTFGKNAKCRDYDFLFGIAGTRSNIDNTTIWTSTGESVSDVNIEIGSDYLLCSNIKTNVVTHPIGNQKTCGKNSVSFRVGAKGQNGATGLTGATGLNGADGRDGKTLWNGTKDPEITWGAPGDMYINATAKTLFGPKNLDGTWPVGVSLVGLKGDQGPIGVTGLTGAQGPGGGSGGAGPAGAAGATGPAGANGTNGTSATLTCAQGGTCALGDIGPGGGKVFIVQTATGAAPWRYMEAAPNTWTGVVGDPSIVWCSITDAYAPPLTTAPASPRTIQTSTAIGAGYSNTQKMLRGCTYGAANAAASYNGGGKSDWHLPSSGEINQLGLRRALVGGFENLYWSSSETSATFEWGQDFTDGSQFTDFKSKSYYVRPVRTF
jgi:hypothetical protein